MAQKPEIRSTFLDQTQKVLRNFWGMSLIFLVLMLNFRVIELLLIFKNHVVDFTFSDVVIYGAIEDLKWIFHFLGLIFIVFLTLSLVSKVFAKILAQGIMTLALIIHVALIFYFTKTLLPLGKDFFAYDWNDLVLTISSSGQLNFTNGILGIVLIAFLLWLLNLGIKLIPIKLNLSLFLTGILIFMIVSFAISPNLISTGSSETRRNVELNKSRFLIEESFDYWFYGGEYYFDFYLRSSKNDLLVQKEFINDEYPFVHKNNYPDVLGPFFDSLQRRPDIVFIFIESLGRAYSGRDAYLGSFTPFLDSLEQHSLVWTNAISSTGRTFGLLPGVFGGLPFGEKGFLELWEEFPYHQSLLSVLKENDYEVRYFIGADRNFDKVSNFLEYQKVNQLEDESTFLPDFQKSPSKNGFSWGYADKELFKNGMRKLPLNPAKPQVIIFQTQTSHDPYLVPERDFYIAKFQSHLTGYLGLNEEKVNEYMAYQNIYMTVLYADDAVKLFINEYKKRPEFRNTIFVITGDHRLAEVPLSSRIDRFHVPMMIYSPLLKRRDYFKGISSHYEITPSILAFLEKNAGINLPEEVTWQGQVLDTARAFQSKIAMPLMRNKNQLMDYIHGDFFLSEDQIFLITDGLNIDPIDNGEVLNRMIGEFEDFKNKNSYMIQTRKLLPPPTYSGN